MLGRANIAVARSASEDIAAALENTVAIDYVCIQHGSGTKRGAVWHTSVLRAGALGDTQAREEKVEGVGVAAVLVDSKI